MLELLADTSAAFVDFSPFVPCINDAGKVAYQARLANGQTGVFCNEGKQLYVAGDGATDVISHPVWVGEQVAFYASVRSGGTALVSSHRGATLTLHRSVGPLGPTANSRGDIAFRAENAIFVLRAGELREVARIGDRYSEFHGLPVVTEEGSVVFRADLTDGDAVIMIEASTLYRRTGELGRFPSANSGGSVAFAVPSEGIMVAKLGEEPKLAITGAFTFRGALISDDGPIIAIATPQGGQLGIYADGLRLIGIGDAMLGSEIVDFALNPVSINSVGCWTMRIKLGDGRQAIVRCEP